MYEANDITGQRDGKCRKRINHHVHDEFKHKQLISESVSPMAYKVVIIFRKNQKWYVHKKNNS